MDMGDIIMNSTKRLLKIKRKKTIHKWIRIVLIIIGILGWYVLVANMEYHWGPCK